MYKEANTTKDNVACKRLKLEEDFADKETGLMERNTTSREKEAVARKKEASAREKEVAACLSEVQRQNKTMMMKKFKESNTNCKRCRTCDVI